VNRRLDIQGMRAVAVTLVVLYHADLPFLPGGLIGVDVFYAISGFLIVGLLTDEVRSAGRMKLLNFWSRRVRRLLPASFLVLMVTLLASKLLLPPLLLAPLARDGAAAALYISNVHFALEGVDYLSGSHPSPLLHYWSLAVEEQFYLLFPIAIALIARFTRRPVRWIVGLLLVGSVASFALCVVVTLKWQPLAFFLLPTRAFELGIGGLAAIGVRHVLARRSHAGTPRWAPVLGVLGLATIIGASVLYTDDMPFPGWRAIVPVLGTTAVLVAGAFHQGIVQRVLSWRPFTYIGDVSYSFYLWHWPFLIIPVLAVDHELPALARAALVVGSLLAASLTYHLVEDPVRGWRPAARRPRLTYATAIAVTVVSVMGSKAAGQLPALDAGQLVAASSGGPVAGIAPVAFIPSNLVPPLDDAKTDVSQALKDNCLQTFTETVPRPCSFGPEDGPTVVLWGDSHAENWAGTLERLADEHGLHLVTLMKASCPISQVESWQPIMNRPFVECDAWRKASIDTMADLDPALVIATEQVGRVVLGQNDQDTHVAAVTDTIDKLRERGLKVAWLADIPEFERDVPICLSAHLDDAAACSESRATTVDDSYRAAERTAVTAAGATWIDATAWVCPGAVCAGVAGNHLMYRDSHHLTAGYARTLAPTMWPFLVSAHPALGSGAVNEATQPPASAEPVTTAPDTDPVLPVTAPTPSKPPVPVTPPAVPATDPVVVDDGTTVPTLPVQPPALPALPGISPALRDGIQ
jgi:peptidoglycan/LPS O-acetylase OafA/YrhL